MNWPYPGMTAQSKRGHTTTVAHFFEGRVSIRHPQKFYVGGRWVEPTSDKRLELVSPVTETRTGSVAEAVETDVDSAVAAARKAFDDGPWPRLSPAERGAYLSRLTEKLKERAEELAHAWTGEVGTLFSMTRGATLWAIGLMDFQAQQAGQHGWEEEFASSQGEQINLRLREPVGVVAAITPWNSPLFSTGLKVAPALVAGCTVILKPSPETPLEAYILCECAEAAGFPDGVINLVPADRTVSEYLVRQPGVDKVSFTGSTVAGKRIGAICADRVARVTLELGGKSAAIVLGDVDIEQVAASLASTSTMAAGQFCANLTRYLVPRGLHDVFVDCLVAKFKAIRIGEPYNADAQMGPLSMKRQFDRVHNYVKQGVAEGATLVTGGGRPAEFERGYYYAPTVFAHVDNRSTIAQEEIFGPVVCVTPFEDVDHAIRIANESDYGLSGAVFTNDPEAAYNIARSIRTGSIKQNGLQNDLKAGFGGFKQSGIGREGGLEAVLPYLETKNVVLSRPTRVKRA
jgi:aldehyde dehydrogenase (NAD+)